MFICKSMDYIDDLFADLGDGMRLMKLLESLTGLIWTIILRCEIWQNQQNVNNLEGQSPFIPPQDQQQQLYHHRKLPKTLYFYGAKLRRMELNLRLRYIFRYPGVRVRDFHRSWRDGLAFNALIHSHAPNLVNFNALKPQERRYNLENAFHIASKHIHVPRLLDPEDVDTDNPDEKSIMIYILLKMMEIDAMKEEYNKEATELLEWIYSKVEDFNYLKHLTSLEDIQQEIQDFKDYRTKEKPIRNDQKNEIEALLFAIQMKRFGQAGWIPSEESSPAAIEKAWRILERAEHEHETQVRNQLIELERLENLAYRFESKKAVRENYLKRNAEDSDRSHLWN
ncbi:spectrin beta chain, non-erythrocytic 1 [Caerostris extrusa]|uniref:Spectrin beta chain, non-erythrocytic 1 n=1 Tax=Caerostris extrusa TaxID=172846 RepID=A0AAV4R8C4_CAEEX|nr:spectrin beta chain, non-erythrocytic 1 [Caerostris extrusa]